MSGYQSVLRVNIHQIQSLKYYFVTHNHIHIAPAKDLMCAEYIAPGINALPDSDEYRDNDEDDNGDDDKANILRKELERPVN